MAPDFILSSNFESEKFALTLTPGKKTSGGKLQVRACRSNLLGYCFMQPEYIITVLYRECTP